MSNASALIPLRYTGPAEHAKAWVKFASRYSKDTLSSQGTQKINLLNDFAFGSETVEEFIKKNAPNEKALVHLKNDLWEACCKNSSLTQNKSDGLRPLNRAITDALIRKWDTCLKVYEKELKAGRKKDWGERNGLSEEQRVAFIKSKPEHGLLFNSIKGVNQFTINVTADTAAKRVANVGIPLTKEQFIEASDDLFLQSLFSYTPETKSKETGKVASFSTFLDRHLFRRLADIDLLFTPIQEVNGIVDDKGISIMNDAPDLKSKTSTEIVEQMEDIKRVMENQPHAPRARDVIKKYFFDGMDTTEIASHLQSNVCNVNQIRYNTLRTISERLEIPPSSKHSKTHKLDGIRSCDKFLTFFRTSPNDKISAYKLMEAAGVSPKVASTVLGERTNQLPSRKFFSAEYEDKFVKHLETLGKTPQEIEEFRTFFRNYEGLTFGPKRVGLVARL